MDRTMGDRFYMQQKEHKPKRVLKRDVIEDLTSLLGKEVGGIDRMTIPHIKELTDAIEKKLIS
jgi:hypothetical protein